MAAVMSSTLTLAHHTRASYEWGRLYKQWYTRLPATVWELVDAFLTDQPYEPREGNGAVAQYAALKEMATLGFFAILGRVVMPVSISEKYNQKVTLDVHSRLAHIARTPLLCNDAGAPALMSAHWCYPIHPKRFIHTLPWTRGRGETNVWGGIRMFKVNLAEEVLCKLDGIWEDAMQLIEEKVEEHNLAAWEEAARVGYLSNEGKDALKKRRELWTENEHAKHESFMYKRARIE